MHETGPATRYLYRKDRALYYTIQPTIVHSQHTIKYGGATSRSYATCLPALKTSIRLS